MPRKRTQGTPASPTKTATSASNSHMGSSRPNEAHQPIKSASTAPSDPSVAEELTAYELTAGIHELIATLQKNLADLASMYLTITGALWVAIATDQLHLSQIAKSTVLSFHMLASILTLQMMATITNAIRLRFVFLNDFTRQYHPKLQEIGCRSFNKLYGSEGTPMAKLTRWGKPTMLLWLALPAFGIGGSIYFIFAPEVT